VTTAQQQRVLPVVLVAFVHVVGLGATLPVLPGAVRDAGGRATSLGVVIGVFAFAALAGRLVAGRATDGRGRIWTLRAGLLLSMAAAAVFALPLGVGGLGAARLLHGFSEALVYTAASTWVLDRTPPDRRPQALALLGAGIWGGYAVGPLVGAAPRHPPGRRGHRRRCRRRAAAPPRLPESSSPPAPARAACAGCCHAA
jgi:MFS family permease